jgi:hypothetical protein
MTLASRQRCTGCTIHHLPPPLAPSRILRSDFGGAQRWSFPLALVDQANLAADPTFVNRVRESLGATCIPVTTEATPTAYHFAR